jgi:hypothetical protein
MKNGLLAAAATTALLAGLCSLGPRAQGLSAQPDVQAAQALSQPGPEQEAGVFGQWLTDGAPQCVPLAKIGSVARVTKLTPEQFQFVRALYIAIPPVSRTLPPGDSAVVAISEGKAMIALVSNGESCARFLAPDFILSMLAAVGRGETGAVGDAI